MLDLAKLECLEAQATPGPWKENSDPWNGNPLIERDDADPETRRTTPIIRCTTPEWGEEIGYEVEDADVEFICAARSAVPALIQRIRQLEEVAAATARILESNAAHATSLHDLRGRIKIATGNLRRHAEEPSGE